MVSISDLYEIYLANPIVQTDTRKLQKGDLFFALKGPNFNGNLFAEKALTLGASYVIADENIFPPNDKILIVDDVLSTLQALAKYHREKFNIPFIAITGSNGKTTTKELIHTVLSSSFKTYTTEGNLNNHIGIPLTLLKIKQDAQMAVVEMGANHLGEIAAYCQYVQPTHGVITNCGKAHLEGFGSELGVRKAKGELFDYLRVHDGTVFLFDDYDYLQEMSKGIKNLVHYGTHGAFVSGSITKNAPFLAVSTSVTNIIHTQLIGEYNFPNVLCAVAIGHHLGVSRENVQSAIEQYIPSNSRSQLMQIGSNRFIVDAYNANPSSMKVAIQNMVNIEADKKVLLLGAMRELGKDSIEEHQKLIAMIDDITWTDVVLVGGDFAYVQHKYHYFENATQAGEWLSKQSFSNTLFLLKGSRAIAMENILQEIK